MRAMTQDDYGDSHVLHLEDVRTPVPADDQVLIAVRAAAVGPDVWHLMTGLPLMVRPAFGIRAPRQRIRGSDVAGTVVAVGPAVTRFSAGDAVFGFGSGAFAEFALARESKLAHRPAALSPEQAAALPISGTTALQALRDSGRVRAGQSVAVLGAGGGVGHMAVQLAVAMGAEVTGVCSTDKLEFVRSLGAAHVVDYTTTDITDGSRHFDVIVDAAGNRPLSELRRALTPRGTLVIVGGDGASGRLMQGFDRSFRAMALSPLVGQRLVALFASENGADLEVLAEYVADGRLLPTVGATFPLERAGDAVDAVGSGHSRGKVVVTVG